MKKGRFIMVLFAVILLLSLSFTMVGYSAEEESGTSGTTWTYTLSGSNATLTGYDEITSGVLIIPSEVDGYTVVGLGSNLFKDNTTITDVTIPDTVTTIGASAFNGCTGLTEVDIAGAVSKIDSYAFSGCTNLESVSIG